MKIEVTLENVLSWLALSLLASALVGCAGPQGEPGPAGDGGEQGPPGVDGRDAIVEVIDPCGKQTDFDEVIVRLADGRLAAYFERSGHRFLTIIPPGQYETTDGTNCRFTVTEDGGVEWNQLSSSSQ